MASAEDLPELQKLTAQNVREIIESDAFDTWYRRYVELRSRIADQKLTQEDAAKQVALMGYKAELSQSDADERVYRAGEAENSAAEAHAEFAEIENDSFEILSAFELQRVRTTDALAALHREEKVVEDDRQRMADLSIELEVLNNNPSRQDAAAKREALETELKTLQAHVESLGDQVENARKVFDRETIKRDTLWVEVEHTWVRSFRAHMERWEYGYIAKRHREKAEKLFAQAAKERARLQEAKDISKTAGESLEELRATYEEHLNQGRQNFRGVLIDEFLYWPRENDIKGTLCLPLVDVNSGLNMQLTALHLYYIDQEKGLEQVQPLPEDHSADADPRLEDFFSVGRPA